MLWVGGYRVNTWHTSRPWMPYSTRTHPALSHTFSARARSSLFLSLSLPASTYVSVCVRAHALVLSLYLSFALPLTLTHSPSPPPYLPPLPPSPPSPPSLPPSLHPPSLPNPSPPPPLSFSLSLLLSLSHALFLCLSQVHAEFGLHSAVIGSMNDLVDSFDNKSSPSKKLFITTKMEAVGDSQKKCQLQVNANKIADGSRRYC